VEQHRQAHLVKVTMVERQAMKLVVVVVVHLRQVAMQLMAPAVLVAMVLLLAVAVAETGPCLQQALLVETLLHIAVGLPLEAVLVVEEQAT
jgi:hypothetical protein